MRGIASRRQIRSLGGSGDEDTGRGGGVLARGDFSLLLSLYGRQRKKNIKKPYSERRTLLAARKEKRKGQEGRSNVPG